MSAKVPPDPARESRGFSLVHLVVVLVLWIVLVAVAAIAVSR